MTRASTIHAKNYLMKSINGPNDPAQEHIYWLQGKAGTGKSTIAITVSDPGIARKGLNHQFEKLILQPLKTVSTSCSEVVRPLVAVIDAFDECEEERDVKVIIYQLSRVNLTTGPLLKFFVTSRFEPAIQRGFDEIDDQYMKFALHTIPEPVIERDITKFLEHLLQQIRKKFKNTVASGWPAQESRASSKTGRDGRAAIHLRSDSMSVY